MMHKAISVAASAAAIPLGLLALPFLAPQSFAAPPASLGPAQPGQGALTGQQMASVAYAAGFRGQSLVVALAVAGAESHWVATAEGDTYAIKGCECHSHGLWQIRSCPHADPLLTYDTSGCHPPLDQGWREALVDPDGNASVAFRIATGSGGWGDWSTYKNRAYEAWLPLAEQAAAAYLAPSPIPIATKPPTQTGGTP